MATCGYCEHRKGKRTCPALAGAICSACCGQHRLRDIACPADCVHLGGLTVTREGATVAFTKADLGAVWAKLHAYADRAGVFRDEALRRVIEGLGPASGERELVVGYVFYGRRDAGGHRLVEHFIAARGRDLSRAEMAAAVAVRDAWASLFEVESAHAGIGLELRELRSGERYRVRELLASSQVAPGDVMFTWLMAVGDHLELSGVACVIPPQHREAACAALEAELAVARTRWPGSPERELVGSTAGAVAEALRAEALRAEALRAEALRAEAYEALARESRPTVAAYEALARESRPTVAAPPPGVAEALGLGAATYDASHAPSPGAWMALADGPKRAAIEAHHRALGVVAPPIHAELHLVVENQLAAGDPPEARAALERLVGDGLDRHEAVHALGSVVATTLWNIARREAPVGRDELVRALAALEASDWRAAPPVDPAPANAIPPLAHEVMYRLVGGFKEAIERAALHLRRGGWRETDILEPAAVLQRSNIEAYLFPLGHAMMAAGWDQRSTLQELQTLSVHAFNVLSFQLHRRKTFWVDESLAFMLACTRLDVRGEGLRLPFPSFALVFGDRETLGLAEALAARDDVATVRGRTLRALTVYVTQIPAALGALGLQVTLMLDAGIDEWPWLVTRDLDIAADHTLDEILDSHFPGVANPDPIFASDELRRLLGLVINATLFATSSPSWPELAPRARPPRVPAAPGGRAVRHPEPEGTGERVWHLPGKIPISQIRALRDLRDSREHGALFARFMVRGHWRRALGTWRDQRARWIEPYWRGPPLGDIVEREYRLKP